MGEAWGAVASELGGVGDLVTWWSRTTGMWRAELGNPCDEAVAWQPFHRSHSIGAILLHLADVEGRWMEECLAGRPRPEDELALLRSHDNKPHENSWVDPPEWPFSQYIEVLSWIRNRSISTLHQVGCPEFVFEGPRGRCSVSDAVRFLCFHESYHAGQAVLHRVHHEWGGIEPA